MKFPTWSAGVVAVCCALGAWPGTAAAAGHPAGGSAAHPAATAKPVREKPATKKKTLPAKGPYGGVDRQDPVAVGEAFTRATLTFDTATQTSENPATVRSTIWCTPSFRAKMLSELPQGSPGAQWILWSAHKAVTTVAVRWVPSGAPAETTTTAYESYSVTVTPHGEHGWTGASDYYVMFVTLSRTGLKAPWEVADFEVQQWWPSKADK